MKRMLFVCLSLVCAQVWAQTHPRLWLSSADVPRLRAWAVAGNPFYNDALRPLAERAKTEMDRGDVPGRDCGSTEFEAYPTESYAELFAFMSQVENDALLRADYASRARTLLMGIINQALQGPASQDNYTCPENMQRGYPPFRSPRFFTEDSNRARWHGEAFALVVDWIYPSLSASDKSAIRSVFLRWSQEIIERGYHHPEPVGMVNDQALFANRSQLRWSGNNYFTAHMRNLGMMALSFDAADDANDQLRNYLGNATGAWLYLFDRLSRTDSKGGLLPEGYEYSPQTASYAIQFLLSLKTAGADTCGQHCRLSANPFWDDFLSAFYHSLSPAKVQDVDAGSSHLPAWYGDGGEYRASDFISAFGAMGAYDILNNNSSRLQSLRWAQTHAVPGGADRLLRRAANPDDFRHAILYFMLFDPTASAASDPRPALPLNFYAPGLNMILARKSWDANASWFSYGLPWGGIDHQQATGNYFEWYRNGEWLTKARNGYPDIAEGIASSEFRNLIAIENNRPERDASDWRTDLWQRGSQWNLVASGDPVLSATSSNSHYVYALGDATALYNSSSENSSDVLHASRSILWLKDSDSVVVFDRANSRSDNRFKRWWLQLANPASVSANRASSTTAGGQQLQVTSLLPVAASLQAVDTNEAHIDQTAARHEIMRVRLRIDAPGNPPSVRFLNVLQAANAGASMESVELVQSSDAAWQGSRIGNTVVMFPHTPGSVASSISYSTNAVSAPAGTHIITGLQPDTLYGISINGNSLTLQAGGNLRSDNAGVLRHVVGGSNGAAGLFVGNRSNYSVLGGTNGVSVTDNVGSEGTHDVSTLARLQFADRQVALDINGNAGKVFRLYQAAFDRAPDQGGFGFHLYTIEGAGYSLRQVGQNFANSAEFAAKYANADNSQFVTLLYANILHRTPDAGGFAFWKSVLDSGGTDRVGVLIEFSESQENRDGTAATLRNGIDFLTFRP
jgi:hypothetical protein